MHTFWILAYSCYPIKVATKYMYNSQAAKDLCERSVQLSSSLYTLSWPLVLYKEVIIIAQTLYYNNMSLGSNTVLWSVVC